MASSKLLKIVLTRSSHTVGYISRRVVSEEAIRLIYEGGTVTVSQGAVSRTGSSWTLLKKRLRLAAVNKGIPFRDQRLPMDRI